MKNPALVSGIVDEKANPVTGIVDANPTLLQGYSMQSQPCYMDSRCKVNPVAGLADEKANPVAVRVDAKPTLLHR